MLHAESDGTLRVGKTSFHYWHSFLLRCVGMKATIDVVFDFGVHPEMHAHENVEHGTQHRSVLLQDWTREVISGQFLNRIQSSPLHSRWGIGWLCFDVLSWVFLFMTQNCASTHINLIMCETYNRILLRVTSRLSNQYSRRNYRTLDHRMG